MVLFKVKLASKSQMDKQFLLIRIYGMQNKTGVRFIEAFKDIPEEEESWCGTAPSDM